jgi:hypothetical protein
MRRYIAILLSVMPTIYLLCCGGLAKATDIDFYDSNIIQTGDIYDTVNLYGSANVNMIGGVVTGRINAYNTSIMNISGGTMEGPDMTFINLHDFAVLNLSGGNFRTDDLATWIYPSQSIVNIYGYGLSLSPYYSDKVATGFWESGTPFKFILARTENAQINLHEIPEPTTAFLLGLGIILARKRLLK